ncbi:MAG: hypothetical protein KUG78_12210 [Kangiellaceae bacterium]|nr:hypothetical protein [Kangiellaceae bacterium]
MKLNTQQLKSLCTIAEQAALHAGTMIAGYISNTGYQQQLQVTKKSAGSSIASQVVSEVDLKSETVILDILKPTLEQYELALLSEETIDDRSRFDKDYFWCIDPLDGTLAFTQGKPGFSVSIALVSKQGEAVIGVVFNPSTGELISSVKGLGVFNNGHPYKIFQPTNCSTNFLTIIAEKSLLESEVFNRLTDKLGTFCQQQGYVGIKRVTGGGAVVNACQIIDEAPAVYFKLPKKSDGGGSLWDFSATEAIFKEANLPVTDMLGNNLVLNNSQTTYMNHCGVLFASNRSFAAELIRLYSQIR